VTEEDIKSLPCFLVLLFSPNFIPAIIFFQLDADLSYVFVNFLLFLMPE